MALDFTTAPKAQEGLPLAAEPRPRAPTAEELETAAEILRARTEASLPDPAAEPAMDEQGRPVAASRRERAPRGRRETPAVQPSATEERATLREQRAQVAQKLDEAIAAIAAKPQETGTVESRAGERGPRREAQRGDLRDARIRPTGRVVELPNMGIRADPLQPVTPQVTDPFDRYSDKAIAELAKLRRNILHQQPAQAEMLERYPSPRPEIGVRPAELSAAHARARAAEHVVRDNHLRGNHTSLFDGETTFRMVAATYPEDGVGRNAGPPPNLDPKAQARWALDRAEWDGLISHNQYREAWDWLSERGLLAQNSGDALAATYREASRESRDIGVVFAERGAPINIRPEPPSVSAARLARGEALFRTVAATYRDGGEGLHALPRAEHAPDGDRVQWAVRQARTDGIIDASQAAAIRDFLSYNRLDQPGKTNLLESVYHRAGAESPTMAVNMGAPPLAPSQIAKAREQVERGVTTPQTATAERDFSEDDWDAYEATREYDEPYDGPTWRDRLAERDPMDPNQAYADEYAARPEEAAAPASVSETARAEAAFRTVAATYHEAGEGRHLLPSAEHILDGDRLNWALQQAERDGVLTSAQAVQAYGWAESQGLAGPENAARLDERFAAVRAESPHMAIDLPSRIDPAKLARAQVMAKEAEEALHRSHPAGTPEVLARGETAFKTVAATYTPRDPIDSPNGITLAANIADGDRVGWAIRQATRDGVITAQQADAARTWIRAYHLDQPGREKTLMDKYTKAGRENPELRVQLGAIDTRISNDLLADTDMHRNVLAVRDAQLSERSAALAQSVHGIYANGQRLLGRAEAMSPTEARDAFVALARGEGPLTEGMQYAGERKVSEAAIRAVARSAGVNGEDGTPLFPGETPEQREALRRCVDSALAAPPSTRPGDSDRAHAVRTYIAEVQALNSDVPLGREGRAQLASAFGPVYDHQSDLDRTLRPSFPLDPTITEAEDRAIAAVEQRIDQLVAVGERHGVDTGEFRKNVIGALAPAPGDAPAQSQRDVAIARITGAIEDNLNRPEPLTGDERREIRTAAGRAYDQQVTLDSLTFRLSDPAERSPVSPAVEQVAMLGGQRAEAQHKLAVAVAEAEQTFGLPAGSGRAAVTDVINQNLDRAARETTGRVLNDHKLNSQGRPVPHQRNISCYCCGTMRLEGKRGFNMNGHKRTEIEKTGERDYMVCRPCRASGIELSHAATELAPRIHTLETRGISFQPQASPGKGVPFADEVGFQVMGEQVIARQKALMAANTLQDPNEKRTVSEIFDAKLEQLEKQDTRGRDDNVESLFDDRDGSGNAWEKGAEERWMEAHFANFPEFDIGKEMPDLTEANTPGHDEVLEDYLARMIEHEDLDPAVYPLPRDGEDVRSYADRTLPAEHALHAAEVAARTGDLREMVEAVYPGQTDEVMERIAAAVDNHEMVDDSFNDLDDWGTPIDGVTISDERYEALLEAVDGYQNAVEEMDGALERHMEGAETALEVYQDAHARYDRYFDHMDLPTPAETQLRLVERDANFERAVARIEGVDDPAVRDALTSRAFLQYDLAKLTNMREAYEQTREIPDARERRQTRENVAAGPDHADWQKRNADLQLASGLYKPKDMTDAAYAAVRAERLGRINHMWKPSYAGDPFTRANESRVSPSPVLLRGIDDNEGALRTHNNRIRGFLDDSPANKLEGLTLATFEKEHGVINPKDVKPWETLDNTPHHRETADRAIRQEWQTGAPSEYRVEKAMEAYSRDLEGVADTRDSRVPERLDRDLRKQALRAANIMPQTLRTARQAEVKLAREAREPGSTAPLTPREKAALEQVQAATRPVEAALVTTREAVEAANPQAGLPDEPARPLFNAVNHHVKHEDLLAQQNTLRRQDDTLGTVQDALRDTDAAYSRSRKNVEAQLANRFAETTPVKERLNKMTDAEIRAEAAVLATGADGSLARLAAPLGRMDADRMQSLNRATGIALEDFAHTRSVRRDSLAWSAEKLELPKNTPAKDLQKAAETRSADVREKLKGVDNEIATLGRPPEPREIKRLFDALPQERQERAVTALPKLQPLLDRANAAPSRAAELAYSR